MKKKKKKAEEQVVVEYSNDIRDYPKYNYSKALAKGIKICKKYGIPISDSIDDNVQFVKRNDCYAYCERIRIGNIRGYKIYMTSLFYDQYKNDKEAMINIILHELCHTIRRCFDHGKNWKENVMKLNEYGFKINPYPYTTKQTDLI